MMFGSDIAATARLSRLTVCLHGVLGWLCGDTGVVRARPTITGMLCGLPVGWLIMFTLSAVWSGPRISWSGLLDRVRARLAGSSVTSKGRKLSRSVQLCRDNEELVSRLSSKTGITIAERWWSACQSGVGGKSLVGVEWSIGLEAGGVDVRITILGCDTFS